MPTVVGVRFRSAGKIYSFDAAGFGDLKCSEYVVVETTHGQEVGQVVITAREVGEKDAPQGALKGIIRRAHPWDMIQMLRNKGREREALERCQQRVHEHGLPMKVVRAEYNFDGTRLTFYFTAEKRVDFRKLVKDLARTFRARIELKQIGVRDEAKLIGGLGRCGRVLCCESWLCEFAPVSSKMAKQQDLPLNPAEISGVCGRLLCCLAFENETYVEAKRWMPKVGQDVVTPHGLGRVMAINMLKETVQVELESEVAIELAAGEVKLKERSTGSRKNHRPRHRGR